MATHGDQAALASCSGDVFPILQLPTHLVIEISFPNSTDAL